MQKAPLNDRSPIHWNRSRAALHFVWHPGRAVAADPGEYGGLTGLSVENGQAIGHGGLPPEYAALSDLWELAVRYHSSHSDAVGDPPGEYIRFVELGRETATSPWRLLEVGTGP